MLVEWKRLLNEGNEIMKGISSKKITNNWEYKITNNNNKYICKKENC